ncbi:glycosyltransferase family 4 protein [Lacinutrix sp. C3R15]|uniref:glycosyltransferase family 4 protein n=1 Tax=Flavobacteriaceae TaxID=49546 RepID=UPI001C0A3BFF|nr:MULTISPECIES: glycosyltransferase family 4 protein [Flavobacteriaceae]MBU2938615.1 glycosyltransferase family 4 protein [Lacinutrix sp. C3R15]MDO6621929.1 glycosyltransferase family 4 protein [Oceanihabitans sp. 1_MG-2023]
MKRKKLAFIIPSLKAGGAERVVSTLTNQLIKDFDIVIVVLYTCVPFYNLNSNIKVVFCKDNYNSTPTFFQSISNHLALKNTCKKVILKENADIIIGFTTIANIYSVLIAKQIKVPSIISERIHPQFGSISSFWVKARKLIYPKTNALVIQTKEIKNYFTKYIQAEKVKIINNPLAEELVIQRDTHTSKSNHIICVGRLTEQKNQELLIRAFANIKRNDWKLLLIGEGNKKEAYKQLVDNLKLNDSIDFIGNVKDVSAYYNSAKIFVLPSNYEGFPNALIEAMYFGLSCIATNCPSGPSEIINDGENGFLIPVKDQLALEQKLSTLINNNNLQIQFKEKAILSTSVFEAQHIANKWKELIYKFL